jgi:hypothetical protein
MLRLRQTVNSRKLPYGTYISLQDRGLLQAAASHDRPSHRDVILLKPRCHAGVANHG